MVNVYVAAGPDGVRESRILTALALGDWGAPPQELCHDHRGRPYLPEGPEISLSHTHRAAAVALGPERLGVDLERHRPIRENLPRRVLSEGEYAWYYARGSQNRDFFALWTLKESYYKYLGTGLPGIPNQTAFRCLGGNWTLGGEPELYFTLWQTESLSLALCSRERLVRLRRFPESSD